MAQQIDIPNSSAAKVTTTRGFVDEAEVPLDVIADATGGGEVRIDLELRRRVMETPWMSSYGVCEAIPPRYAEFVGGGLLRHLAAAGTEAA